MVREPVQKQEVVGVFDASDHRVCCRRAYEDRAVNLELTLKVPFHS